MDDKLSLKKLQQLERLSARDTTVIHEYLRIIEHESPQLWRPGQEGRRIAISKLDRVTLTSKPLTRKKQDGIVKKTPGRPRVKYDLKHRFQGRITARELKECRDIAVAMWHSYCEQCRDHDRIYWQIMQKNKYLNQESELAGVLAWWETEKKPARPRQAKEYQERRIPRQMNLGTTVFIHKRETKLTRNWLELYSLERRTHIWLPLNLSSYHMNVLTVTDAKTVQLIHHDTGRWYAHVTVVYPAPELQDKNKPLALVSTDLGINMAATAVLLTADGLGELTTEKIRFFDQKKKKQMINDLDRQIASLQRRKDKYRQKGCPTYGMTRKLNKRRHRRKHLAIQYDHELTAQIVRWVHKLSTRYTVYVALGKLKGIRNSRRKGDGKSRGHRRKLHLWAFARITGMLTYKLQQIGQSPEQLIVIQESWTSKTCWKCGSTETSRPFQALLLCHACGAQLQADINGAINIAFKLIYSLDDPALDQWLRNPPFDQNNGRNGASAAGRNSPFRGKDSQTSRPKNGDETASAVQIGSGTRKLQARSDGDSVEYPPV